MGFNDNDFLILLVGMFNDFKNHTFLVDIFNEYKKLNNKANLILVGDGYLQESIQKKVDELKLNDFVYFLGKRLDVNEILSMCDIYVMPSLSEGLSIALLEAQVNGLKCYTSDGVDRKSDVTGNVEFLPLKNSSKDWASIIYNNNNDRDMDVIKKIPKNFDYKESCKRVYDFYYMNIIKKGFKNG